MPDYEELFPGRFLKAADLEGHEPTLTIRTVTKTDLPTDDGGDETRGVMYFEGKEKGWVLGRFNAECIVAMHGTDYAEWDGHQITLCVRPCEFKGAYYQKPSIRVKGSPELTEHTTIDVKLKRRRPITVILLPTGKAQ